MSVNDAELAEVWPAFHLEHAFATRVDEICRNYEKAVATARLEYGTPSCAPDTPVTAGEP